MYSHLHPSRPIPVPGLVFDLQQNELSVLTLLLVPLLRYASLVH